MKKIKKNIKLNTKNINLTNVLYTFFDIAKEMIILILGYLVTISYFSNDNNKLDIIIELLKQNINNFHNRGGNFDTFSNISNIRDKIKLMYYTFINNNFNLEEEITTKTETSILIFYIILLGMTNAFHYVTIPSFNTNDKLKELLYNFFIKAFGIIFIPLILFSLFLYIVILIQSIIFILDNLKLDISFSYVSIFFLFLYLSWGYALYFYVNNFINDLSFSTIENTNIIAIISLIGVILIDYLIFYTDAVSFICSSLLFMNFSVFKHFMNNIIENKRSLFTFQYIFALFIILYMGYSIWTEHNLFYIPIALVMIFIFTIVYLLYPTIYDKNLIENNNNNNIGNNNINNNNNNIGNNNINNNNNNMGNNNNIGNDNNVNGK